MKFKNIFTVLFLTVTSLVGMSSCSDDSVPPVSLITVEDAAQIASEDTIQLDAFAKGISFEIVGGEGNYVIKNHHENIVDYRYDGKILTFTPKGLGTATVQIFDIAGNGFTLYIKVTYHETVFQVKSLESDAFGENMTLGKVNELKKRIKEDSMVQPGGLYVFTFRNESQNEGSVDVFSKETDKPLSGVFRMERKYTEEGQIYQQYLITMASGDVHKMMLMEYKLGAEQTTVHVFREDVTAAYQLAYSELEKAVLIQELNF